MIQDLLDVASSDVLLVLNNAQSLHNLLRVILQVPNAVIERTLAFLELLELPVADAKEHAIKEDDLCEPVDTYIESLVISEIRNDFVGDAITVKVYLFLTRSL